jgi:hypothetical protein
MNPQGGANFDPKEFIFLSLEHAQYLSYFSLLRDDFLRDDFFSFYYINKRKISNPPPPSGKAQF